MIGCKSLLVITALLVPAAQASTIVRGAECGTAGLGEAGEIYGDRRGFRRWCGRAAGAVRRAERRLVHASRELHDTIRGSGRFGVFDTDPFITFGATTTNSIAGTVTYAFLFGTPIIPGFYNAAHSTGGVTVTPERRTIRQSAPGPFIPRIFPATVRWGWRRRT